MKKAITFRLDEKLIEQLKSESKKNYMTATGLMTKLLVEHFEAKALSERHNKQYQACGGEE